MSIKISQPDQGARFQSVDACRMIAMFFVVIIHTAPFRTVNLDHEDLFSAGAVLNVIARFAVPFFFVVSGYFWGRKIANGSPLWPVSLQMIRKIAINYLVFCLLYLLPTQLVSIHKYGLSGPFNAKLTALHDIFNQPAVNWLFTGTEVHLWFLPALICAIFFSALFIHFKRVNALIVFAVILFIVGVLAKAYSVTPLGISMDFNTRNGPFFSLLFFVSGYLMSRTSPKPDWFWKGGLVMASGYVIQFSELHFLQLMYGVSPIQDYVFGTLMLGIGAAMIALSNLPALSNKTMAYIGRYTLGIYAIHVIFTENLWGLRSFGPLMQAMLVVIVFALSAGTTLALAKNKKMAQFLT